MRKPRPGKVLHHIRTWAGQLVPPVVAAPSSCVCTAYFREAGREVVISEGGQWACGWWPRVESLMFQAEKQRNTQEACGSRKSALWATSLTETCSCHHVSIEIPFWAAPIFSVEKENLAQEDTPENKLSTPKLEEGSWGIHSLSLGEFSLQGSMVAYNFPLRKIAGSGLQPFLPVKGSPCTPRLALRVCLLGRKMYRCASSGSLPYVLLVQESPHSGNRNNI